MTSKSRDEVHFEEEWAETHSGEQFLMAEDGEGSNKLIIFSTTRLGNIRNLAEADKVFMDRTFQTCPRLFYQIFTIHAFKNGPTVFSLENYAHPCTHMPIHVHIRHNELYYGLTGSIIFELYSLSLIS